MKFQSKILRGIILATLMVASVLTALTVVEHKYLPQTSGFFAGYLRTDIETYPEAERRPIIEYLDASKVVADRAAGLLASGPEEDLFREMEASAKANGQQFESSGQAEQLRTIFGSVTSLEYQAQSKVEYGDNPDVHDLGRATSEVVYAVRTKKRPEGGLFLEIKTFQIGGKHQVFFLASLRN